VSEWLATVVLFGMSTIACAQSGETLAFYKFKVDHGTLPAVTVLVEIQTDGTGLVNAATFNARKQNHRPLSTEEAAAFIAQVKQLSFWTMPRTLTPPCTQDVRRDGAACPVSADGEVWSLEARDG